MFDKSWSEGNNLRSVSVSLCARCLIRVGVKATTHVKATTYVLCLSLCARCLMRVGVKATTYVKATTCVLCLSLGVLGV